MINLNVYGNFRQKILINFFLTLSFSMFFVSPYTQVAAASKPVVKVKGVKRGQMISLPEPRLKGTISLEEVLAGRESVRRFTSSSLGLQELSQLLWAAQGVTRKWGGRTAPSAGALYPLEIYVAKHDGLFRYMPVKHQLFYVSQRNPIPAIAEAALGQSCIREAPAVLVICAVYERASGKYRDRAERYVKMEAGHVAQNILLQAGAMGLGAVPVGAFYDHAIQQSLQLPLDHQPLYLIPAGRPAK